MCRYLSKSKTPAHLVPLAGEIDQRLNKSWIFRESILPISCNAVCSMKPIRICAVHCRQSIEVNYDMCFPLFGFLFKMLSCSAPETAIVCHTISICTGHYGLCRRDITQIVRFYKMMLSIGKAFHCHNKQMSSRNCQHPLIHRTTKITDSHLQQFRTYRCADGTIRRVV